MSHVSETKNRSLTQASISLQFYYTLYTSDRNQVSHVIDLIQTKISRIFNCSVLITCPNERHICPILLHSALLLLHGYFRVVRMWHHYITQSVCQGFLYQFKVQIIAQTHTVSLIKIFQRTFSNHKHSMHRLVTTISLLALFLGHF